MFKDLIQTMVYLTSLTVCYGTIKNIKKKLMFSYNFLGPKVSRHDLLSSFQIKGTYLSFYWFYGSKKGNYYKFDIVYTCLNQ